MNVVTGLQEMAAVVERAGSLRIEHTDAHGVVPVEVKTGQTPDAPFPSHVMQLAREAGILHIDGG